jgi:hypothetical protein
MTIDLTKPSVLSEQVPAGLYLPSHVIKVVEVAKKYAGPEVRWVLVTFDLTHRGRRSLVRPSTHRREVRTRTIARRVRPSSWSPVIY